MLHPSMLGHGPEYQKDVLRQWYYLLHDQIQIQNKGQGKKKNVWLGKMAEQGSPQPHRPWTSIPFLVGAVPSACPVSVQPH